MDSVKVAAAFFAENAGFSYTPGKETPEQGRKRCALLLARAERHAWRKGVTFAWSIDPDITSQDFSDEAPAWELYQCVARDSNGRCIASLHGIDFGRDGSPNSSTYARVVQAELAAEARDRM